jgi:hypothetical protein
MKDYIVFSVIYSLAVALGFALGWMVRGLLTRKKATQFRPTVLFRP